MIRIGLDLDNCIFDSEPIYKKAFEGTKYTYFLPQKYLNNIEVSMEFL